MGVVQGKVVGIHDTNKRFQQKNTRPPLHNAKHQALILWIAEDPKPKNLNRKSKSGSARVME